MNTGKTLFAQLMGFLPWTTFSRYVTRYEDDKGIRSLTCAEQLRVMAFAQPTYHESLRDIGLCLSVFPWAHFRTTKAAVKIGARQDSCRLSHAGGDHAILATRHALYLSVLDLNPPGGLATLETEHRSAP